MGLFSWLFRKKKKEYDRFEPTDYQEQFLKDGSSEKKKKASAKKAEPGNNTVKAEVKEKPAQKQVKPAASAAPAPKAKAESKTSKAAEKPKAKTEPKASKTEEKPKAKPTAPSVELEDDSPEVKGAVAVEESKATANGKFDIRKAKDGRYFFSLYASNHAVIAYSQIYSSTSAVNTGINSVIANSPKAPTEDTTLKNPTTLPCPKWEIYIDKAGQYRFRLYAANGLCVCHSSHGYTTKSGCKGGIESIKRFSAEARVDKSYLNKE